MQRHDDLIKATLILISGGGSTIPSAQEGKSGSIYLVELISCLSHANAHAFHENPDCIYTELTFQNP